MTTSLNIVTASDLGPEFNPGGITPNLLRIDVSKVTLTSPILGQTTLGNALVALGSGAATTSAPFSDIQSGAADGKYITPDALKAAAAAGFQWQVNLSGLGPIFTAVSTDSSGVVVSAHQGGAGNSDAIDASIGGDGNGNAVTAGVNGTGSGHAVHGAINGNGLGAGVNGVNWGSGPGAGVIGTIQGTGTGNGVRGVVFGGNASSAVQGVTANSNGAHGVAGIAGAAGSGHGVFGHALGSGVSVYAVGNIFATGTITSSDEALKTNIEDANPVAAAAWSKGLRWKTFLKYQNPADYVAVNAALEQIGQPPVSTDMTPENGQMVVGTQVGLLAQDVQTLAASTVYGSYVVHKAPNGALALDYTSIQSLVNAGVAARLAALEAKVGI